MLGLAASAASVYGAAYVGSAYEGFDYIADTQFNTGTALNGGTGWNAAGDFSPNTAAWGAALSSGTIRNVSSSGLDFSNPAYPTETGLGAVVGGTGTAGANAGRSLGQTVDAGTIYFSYLMQKTVDTVRTVNLSFFSGTNERLAIGQIANNVNLRNPDGSVDSVGTPNTGDFAALISNSQNNAAFNGVYTSAVPINVALNTTFLVVGKIEFGFSGGVEDRLSLYIDPSSLTDEGLVSPYLQVGVNDFGSVTAFRIFAGGNQTSPFVFDASAAIFDEVRFGTTYTGVTGAIPEPSTYAGIAGACGLVLAALRRRRNG